MRAHILKTRFFGPILLGRGVQVGNGWNQILYQDYQWPRLHISYWASPAPFFTAQGQILAPCMLLPNKEDCSCPSCSAPHPAPMPARCA
jgi:hypothetical protein